ncbi:MAG: hypothetical protein IIZ60_08265 [Clostridia bacterium]|nr:hypothetical protein [Clostridia bacterium]
MFGTVVLLLLILTVFAGCRGSSDAQNTGFGSPGGNYQNEPEERELCRFPSFEIRLPETWYARGNTTQELASASDDSVFGFAGTSNTPEAEWIRALCLFRSTEFYPDQTVFSYEKQTAVPEGKRVTGTLSNGRLGTTFSFCGYCFQDTGGFWIILSPDPDGAAKTEELADEVYQTYRVL